MEELFEKQGKKKVFLICWISLTVILVFSIFVSYFTFLKYDYKGTRLKLISVTRSNVVMEDSDGNRLTMEAERDYYSGVMFNSYTVNYRDELMEYNNGYNELHEVRYVFSDGSEWIGDFIYISINNESPPYDDFTELQHAEKALFDRLIAYFSGEKSGGVHAGVCISGMLLLFLGTSSFIFPEKYWQLQTFLSVKNGEPTELALFLNRVAGVLYVILAFGFLIYLLSL